MSQTNFSRFKYNPSQINEKEFLDKFVVRLNEFNEIFDDIKNSDYSVPTQHFVIIGQRGQGKTTLLRKLSLEIKNDKKLSQFLLPIQFTEEQYQIRSLCRLWEVVAEELENFYEEEFDGIVDILEDEYEKDDYELKCFSLLESKIKKQKKNLVLLIDNIDELFGKLKEKEQKQLREILISSPSIKIIGGSTKMFEHQYDYAKPFYEFFKIVKLKGLSSEDAIKFLRTIANDEQKAKIEEVIKNQKAKIETLLQLTGGVPRTLVILFDIFISTDGDAFDDLLKLLDEATPLYKHRMDDLPPVLQDIVHTIALNWDGMLTKEIAQKTKLESKVVSAQLKQLQKYQIIEAVSVGKNNIYKIEERFFNIWYLMRFGRKKDRSRVEWLVRFLSEWYSKEELEDKALSLISSSKDNLINEEYLYYMCEALSYTGVLDSEIECKLKKGSRDYFERVKSDFQKDLTPSDKEIYNKVIPLIHENNITEAIKILEKSKKQSGLIHSLYLLIFIKNKEFDKINLHIEGVLKNADSLSLMTIIAIFFALGIYHEMLEQLAKNNYELGCDDFNIYVLSIILLWNEKFDESYNKLDEFLKSNCVKGNEIKDYFILLISKKQYHKAKEFFEIKEYQLKEKFKPIWYALMTLMQDEYPNEIKKMGSELQEVVEGVLKKVEEYREKYKI